MKQKHFLRLFILVICVAFCSVLHAQEYKTTTLPFNADGLMIKEGGGYQETDAGPSCSGITLNALKLGHKDIPLKSTSITSGCMIRTRDYGNIRIKINTATFTCNVLVTQAQMKEFKKLLTQHH